MKLKEPKDEFIRNTNRMYIHPTPNAQPTPNLHIAPCRGKFMALAPAYLGPIRCTYNGHLPARSFMHEAQKGVGCFLSLDNERGHELQRTVADPGCCALPEDPFHPDYQRKVAGEELRGRRMLEFGLIKALSQSQYCHESLLMASIWIEKKRSQHNQALSPKHVPTGGAATTWTDTDTSPRPYTYSGPDSPDSSSSRTE